MAKLFKLSDETQNLIDKVAAEFGLKQHRLCDYGGC